MTQYADGMASSNTYGFKNKIIGGDFTTNPWQRGTSFSASANGTYSADRFKTNMSSDGVIDIAKTADAPAVSEAGVFTQHCLRLDVTTADVTIAASQFCRLFQSIEGLNSASFGFGQAGTRYVTLSFWHKHTKTGTYCVHLQNSAGTRSYVAEYVQDVTATWEKAVITIPVDTSGTWLYDTGIGLVVGFAVATGTDYQTTANTWATGPYHATANQVNALDSISNDFKLALIQLEAGSTSTPFEARDYGDVLRQCQRYYETGLLIGMMAGTDSTGEFRGYSSWKVQKRSVPIISYTDGIGNASKFTTYTAAGAGTNNVTPATYAGVDASVFGGASDTSFVRGYMKHTTLACGFTVIAAGSAEL